MSAVEEMPAAAPAAIASPLFEVPAASEIEQWSRDAYFVSQIAVRLAKTSFVPKTYEGDPAQVTAAILTGQEIGLSPMASLRSIDIIHGVPGMRALAMRALVQSAGHEIWTVESNATRAIVRGQRRGSDKPEQSEWTIDRAKGLNLMGKDNWRQQPIAMLLARATSECARLIAADVLLGIPYSIEELEDLGAEASVGDAPVKRTASRTVKRTTLAERIGEPPLDEPAPTEPEQLAVEAAAAAPDDEADEAARTAELALEAEENERAKVAAAAAFESPPVDLEEPPIDWEGPPQ